MPAIDSSPAGCSVAAHLLGGPVLVTGAGGFLGREVVRQYIAAGHDVFALVRPGGSPAPAEVDPARVLAVDLGDPLATDAALAGVGPALVVHAAASAGHPRTAADRHEAWRSNVLATVHLLEALAARRAEGRPARLVHVGSGTEYAPSADPLRETDAGQPLTLRGVTKLAATLAVRQWAADGGHDAVVVRPFSIYGPGEQPTKLVPTLLRCARTGDRFPMLAGESRRDLVHVAEVAEGCRRAAAVASPEAPVLNLGTGVEHTVDEVRRVVEAVVGSPVPVEPAARPVQPHDVAHWVADTSRCRAVLGWQPTITLEAGIRALATLQDPA